MYWMFSLALWGLTPLSKIFQLYHGCIYTGRQIDDAWWDI
jgi:hypothetical protein